MPNHTPGAVKLQRWPSRKFAIHRIPGPGGAAGTSRRWRAVEWRGGGLLKRPGNGKGGIAPHGRRAVATTTQEDKPKATYEQMLTTNKISNEIT